MKLYGKHLIDKIPDATTALLIRLCTYCIFFSLSLSSKPLLPWFCVYLLVSVPPSVALRYALLV